MCSSCTTGVRGWTLEAGAGTLPTGKGLSRAQRSEVIPKAIQCVYSYSCFFVSWILHFSECNNTLVNVTFNMCVCTLQRPYLPFHLSLLFSLSLSCLSFLTLNFPPVPPLSFTSSSLSSHPSPRHATASPPTCPTSQRDSPIPRDRADSPDCPS